MFDVKIETQQTIFLNTHTLILVLFYFVFNALKTELSAAQLFNQKDTFKNA